VVKYSGKTEAGYLYGYSLSPYMRLRISIGMPNFEMPNLDSVNLVQWLTTIEIRYFEIRHSNLGWIKRKTEQTVFVSKRSKNGPNSARGAFFLVTEAHLVLFTVYLLHELKVPIW